MMKSEKLKSILNRVEAFCSFVFWPRWGYETILSGCSRKGKK